jgi:hypothetical protein
MLMDMNLFGSPRHEPGSGSTREGHRILNLSSEQMETVHSLEEKAGGSEKVAIAGEQQTDDHPKPDAQEQGGAGGSGRGEVDAALDRLGVRHVDEGVASQQVLSRLRWAAAGEVPVVHARDCLWFRVI